MQQLFLSQKHTELPAAFASGICHIN